MKILTLPHFFQLPLSHEAMDELVSLNIALHGLQRNPHELDSWSWTPSKGSYSTRSYYTLAHAHLPNDDPCKWIWKSNCITKIKVFAWLMLNDTLNPRGMLLRRHWRYEEDYNLYPMCVTQLHEDRDHLFFKCTFSNRVWNYLQIKWYAGLSPRERILAAKRSFQHPFFFEVVYLAAWSIWTTRNDKIFRQIRPTFGDWKAKFIHDITLHSHKMTDSIQPLLLHWINALP